MAAVRVVVVHVAPRVDAAAVFAVLAVVVVVRVVVVIDGSRVLGVTRVRFVVLDQKVGLRTLSHLTLRRIFHFV